MLYSLLSMVVTSLALLYIPIYPIANDPILSSVFGGALVGIAGGLIFRSAASTGGFDIIGLLLTRKQDLPLGSILFAMNAVVIAVAGYFFKWDVALYTMLSIFVTGKVVDTVYTNNLKLTLMIISSKGDEIKDKLLAKFVRGITVTDGEGAYTKEKRRILFMVITRYELADIKKIIKETDSKAFVNIMETAQVMGYFRRD